MSKPACSYLTGFPFVACKAKQNINPALAAQLVRDLPKLKQYVGSKVPSPIDAEDIVQDAICKTLAASENSVIQNPIAYLIQVAKGNIAEHWKQQCVQLIDVAEDIQMTHDTLEQQKLFEQRQTAVLEIMSGMPELRRTIFVRRRLDGWSREKIATEYHISLALVKKHISKAMVTLSVELASRGLAEVE